MSSAYSKGWKKASRESAKEAGHYDGRFAPKVIKDPRHEEEKYKCREEVEVPEDWDEDLAEPLVSDAEKGDGPREYSEDVEFSPFATLLD